jgi:hypothetical protein
MRLIAGALLILAASIMFAALWIGSAIHSPALSGIPEARYMTFVWIALGLVGAVMIAVGMASERTRDRQ